MHFSFFLSTVDRFYSFVEGNYQGFNPGTKEVNYSVYLREIEMDDPTVPAEFSVVL